MIGINFISLLTIDTDVIDIDPDDNLIRDKRSRRKPNDTLGVGPAPNNPRNQSDIRYRYPLILIPTYTNYH